MPIRQKSTYSANSIQEGTSIFPSCMKAEQHEAAFSAQKMDESSPKNEMNTGGKTVENESIKKKQMVGERDYKGRFHCSFL